MAIKVSGTTVIDNDRNISNVGIITATSFSGDGSNITGIAKVGGTLSATASGTLPDGSTVIINTDGTVSVASTLPGKTIATYKTATIDPSPDGQWNSIAHDTTNNKLIWAYRGADSYGYVIVGDIDGITINFGTPVVFLSADVEYVQVVYDSGTDRIIIYDNNRSAAHGFAAFSGAYRVGQISGTSVTFCAAVANPDNGAGNRTTIGQGTSGTFIVHIPQNTSFTQCIGVVGTITGGSTNSISFGTTSLASGCPYGQSTNHATITPFNDSGTDKFVLAYTDYVTLHGTAIIGTQSGTTLTYGTPVEFFSDRVFNVSQTYDTTTNRVVITYRTFVGNVVTGIRNLSCIVGQVSGNSISYGSAVIYNDSTDSENTSIVYDTDKNKVVIGFSSSIADTGYITVGDVTGGATNSISFSSTITYAPHIAYTRMVYDSFNNQTISAYEERAFDDKRSVVVINSDEYNTNLTEDNFIGFSDGSYTNGQTASVKIISNINDAQTGLTTGSKYYIQRDGSLSNTAVIPPNFAGTAISSNKIQIKQ